MAKRKQKWYTVVGVYMDNNQPWMVYVKKGQDGAVSPREAVVSALTQGIISEYPSGQPAVVEVIEGKVKGILGNEKLLALWDGGVLKELDK